jgi:hypothetical protein
VPRVGRSEDTSLAHFDLASASGLSPVLPIIDAFLVRSLYDLYGFSGLFVSVGVVPDRNQEIALNGRADGI